jgi:predicted hydrocarbon binding protein
MISITDLLKERLPNNYFAPDIYVQGDFELGILENRKGTRLFALPEILLEAIYTGLEAEVGSAAGVVLFQCGRWWGKNFYRRFAEEVSQHYSKPLAQMEMVEFLQCLKQCWKTYGWGILDLDCAYYQQGFLVVRVRNSAFGQASPPLNRPMCFAEAGILSAFFSQLTGRELHCTQTACESMGAECNYFVLGLAERVKPAEAWLEEGQDHDTIMERLCHNQISVNLEE